MADACQPDAPNMPDQRSAARAAAQAEAQQASAGAWVPDSVLVVDDSAVQRAHNVGVMRRLGVGLIYEAGDGQEALDLLKMLVLPPALLVTDLEMPGIDGVELIERLSQAHPELPLIVVSSREDTLIHTVEAMARALGQKVVMAMRKPLQQEAVAQALAQWRPAGSGPAARRAEARIDPADLLRALDQGLIQPHFQPKVDVQTGLLRGVESLARWDDPLLGRITPDRFIPLAESQGLIQRLTMAMLDQTLTHLEAWNARGLRLSAAVNLSPQLLLVPGLARDIVELAECHQVDPAQLTLEITEGSVTSQFGTALAALARLRLKGFGLSIDDYGTGFSSMQQLARIPFTELKVDRSFVHGAHKKRNLQVILRSALDMARQLSLLTVAEGVEELDDWRLLQDCGCAVAQGWLIGKAMPPAELPAWIRGHQLQLPRLRRPG